MSKFQFNRKAQKFRSRKSAVLENMANNAVNHFKVEAFDRRSFDGKSWEPNKKQDGRQQLVKTGRMRESITILSRTSDTRKVGTNVPYAQYHNEGTKHLPKRQFIGSSRELEAENKGLLRQFMNTVL
jgi:phage gpG-like protein